MIYNKPATTIDQQVSILLDRGLIIQNLEYAKKSLMEIGYFRLENYWHVMQDNTEKHTFKREQTFEQGMQLYFFDKDLRNIILKYTEEIEISFRTKLIYYLSNELNPWWFSNSDNFKNSVFFGDSIKNIEENIAREKNRDDFIKRHYEKYHDDSRLPPAWKTIEILSLGTISKIYSNINDRKLRNKISKDFGLNCVFFDSFLHTITEVRNICAHCGRLWNRKLNTSLKVLTKEDKWIKILPEVSDRNKIYFFVSYVKFILDFLNKDNAFSEEFKNLMKKYPVIDVRAMGFPVNWEKDIFWSR